jgi:hypothetical protein
MISKMYDLRFDGFNFKLVHELIKARHALFLKAPDLEVILT